MARTAGLVLLTLVAVWSPARAADTGLGRLFFTPAQRTALEEARKKNTRAEVQAIEKPARPPLRSVTVTGVVRRSDGESTVWINGKPVDGTTDDGLKVRVTAGQQAAVIVHEPEKGHTLRLKVGQRADILTGRIEEGYERRAPTAPEAAVPEPAPGPEQQSRTGPSRKPEDPTDGPDTARQGDAEPGEAGEDGR